MRYPLRVAKRTSPKYDTPTTVRLMPDDLELMDKLRERFNWHGLNNPQVIKVALRRLVEESERAA